MILDDEKLGLYLNFKTHTNNRKSLYDFSSKEINEINTLVDNGTFIIRKDKSFFRVDFLSDIEKKLGEELLFKVRIRNNNIFMLENPVPKNNIPITIDNINNINNKIWFVLNSNNPKLENENEDYYLCENDVIRMGNIKLIVKELHIEDKREELEKKDDNMKYKEKESKIKENYDIHKLNENSGPIFNFFPQTKKCFISQEEAGMENIICNICKGNNCNMNNPLIAFCNCNYFHFNCLKYKIKNDSIKYFLNDKKKVDTYYIKRYKCITCSLVFPLAFKIEQIDQAYQLFDIVKPEHGKYMILESIEDKIYYGFLKLIYVIKLTEDNINIGRGRWNGNDINIPDPSISIIHAEIKYDKEKGKILIKNKSHTFGTSILIKNPLIIKNKKILLQNGRTLIEAKLMKVEDFEKNINKNSRRHLPKKD